MRGSTAVMTVTGAVAVILSGVAVTIPAAAATGVGPTVTRQCGNVETGQTFKPAANGLFGARRITAVNESCAFARQLAGKYVENPYSVDSPSKRTSHVNGFRCTWTADNKVAQRVSVRCTKGFSKVTFADRLPNG